MSDIVEKLRKQHEEPEHICRDMCLEAASEIESVRIMIADFIHAWRWYQEDEYDREAPHDCVGNMIRYMENLGYRINHLGITRMKK